MAFDAHANFAYSTVATAPSPATSGTSLVVQTGDGANFPATPFNATIRVASASYPTSSQREIVRVTNISSDTLTITRAQEGTSARSIVIGDVIEVDATAKTFTDIETHVWPVSQGGTNAVNASAAKTNLSIGYATRMFAHRNFG